MNVEQALFAQGQLLGTTASPYAPSVLALRKVLELHKPRRDIRLEHLTNCEAEYTDEPTEWPCETVKAIATALGVEIHG